MKFNYKKRAASDNKNSPKLSKLVNSPRASGKVIPQLEADIQATIVAYLQLKKVEFSITNADRVWGKGGGVRASKVEKGHPDITAVLPVVIDNFKFGLALYIEVKTATGNIKEEQKIKMLRLANSGALCILARDVESVVRVVELFLNKPFSVSAYDKEIQLLKLNLSDRRSKTVRDDLTSHKKS